MAEEKNKQQKQEKNKEEKSEEEVESKIEEKQEGKKQKKIKEKTQEGKSEEKKAKKTERVKEQKPKKTEAVVRAKDLPISTLHAKYICKFIKNKKIEDSIKILRDVERKKIAVPFKGEIPHRKGKRMMSGRYPVKASKYFIKLLKSLYANASVVGLDTDKIKIMARANQASRPYKRFGSTRFKRTHVVIQTK